MDTNDSIIDPQAEVKKLQDLVKKLELQNELLRNNKKLQLESQSLSNSLQNGEIDINVVNYNNNISLSQSDIVKPKHFDSLLESLDEVEIIDVDSVSSKDEEDSWLYSSPKPPSAVQTKVSPYKWVREEFDHPSPDVQSTRKSLIHKLDEVARLSRSTSTPSLNSTPNKSIPTMTRSAENTPHQKGKPVRQSMLATMGSRINTGTYTRPKKAKNGENRSRIQYSNQSSSEDADGPVQKDAPDIETLARMQEESLRQSMHSPFMSPKKVVHNRQQLLSTDTDNSASPIGSNRSSPARYDGDVIRRQSSNSLDSDSPPDSPRGSQYLNTSVQFQESADMRRSLPNMSRLAYQANGLNSSDSSLDRQSGGSEENLAPETRPARTVQAVQHRAVSPSVSSLRQPSAGHRGPSPQRTGLPQPTRRTIPRPSTPGARRTSLPTPRRIGTPVQRPKNNNNINMDDSWKEGCF